MAGFWQLTLVIYPERTFLSGVVLDRMTATSRGKSTMLGNAYAIASSYFRKTKGGARLRLAWGDKAISTQTDEQGAFMFEMDQALENPRDLTFELDGNSLPFDVQQMETYALKEEGCLVISDIDDTVLVSHTNRALKRFITTLFKPNEKRKPVEATMRIFESLGGKDNDYVYVSRSEYNLFPMLHTFMEHHDLPSGPLYLTPFLSFRDLIRNRKDPHFKVKTINFILDHAQHQRIILFGDDTQHDLEVYTEVARTHGSLVEKVYIRQTNSRKDKRDTKAWEALVKNAGIVIYYNDKNPFTH